MQKIRVTFTHLLEELFQVKAFSLPFLVDIPSMATATG
jgi:hypothetical protein